MNRSPVSAAIVALALLVPSCASAPSGRASAERTEETASWALDLFDVGTGLSVLVRGADFSLLYDGGSNDDRATGPSNRLLAYLALALGPSGGAGCRMGDESAMPERRIDHLVASHAHRDHIGLLPDVFRCFSVRNAWDGGGTDSAAYGELLGAIAAERGVVYHSAIAAPADRVARSHGEAHPMPTWATFGEGAVIPLGRLARATVLSVRPAARDPNDASVVLRIDLGRASVLLTGDATGGERKPPGARPSPGSPEAELLERHGAELDVDVLQVGHHGSLTSSRAAFLDAVSPRWALVSSGPTRYGRVVLPDAEVIAELGRRGARVLRTDEGDASCGARADKVGRAADGKPGGCTGFTLRIDASGAVALAKR